MKCPTRFKHIVACLLLPLLLPTLAHAEVVVPQGGVVLNKNTKPTALLGQKTGKAEALENGGQRVVILHPAPNKPYTANITVGCDQPIAKNEPVLAIIKARTVGGVHQAVAVAKLQISASPYTALAPTTEFSIPHEWTEIPVTFIPNEEASLQQAVVQLQCGHRAQTIEVAEIRLYKYPAGTGTEQFPRIQRTYPGREANAPWRKEALARIEKHRKADLTLRVTSADDKPLPNTEIHLRLKRHQFGFGTAVTAKALAGDSADDRQYKAVIDKYFSTVVFENDLKDGSWEPHFSEEKKAKRKAELEASFKWLSERNISVRGHYLMQIPTPYNLHGVQDSQLIRERVLASVRERLDFVKDRVYEWDVINHPIAWSGADMLNKRPGLERLDEEVYQLARTYTSLPFFVNEDQVFRPGPQHDDTYAYIRTLQEKGLSIQGLGNQAHFSETYLPSPEHLLAVTDHFAQLVSRQSITEYDIVTTNDEDLAADYTRDVLIATFSHPAYTSFLFWGFWEGSHWKPEAASWNKDWSIKARGEVIEEWIGKQWRTDVTLKTDAQGQLQWRGFPGWYEVVVGNTSHLTYLTQEKSVGELRLQAPKSE